MRYCGSIDTIPAYQRVKKQPQSPEHSNIRPVKASNHVQNDRRSRKSSPNSHHIISNITYKLHMSSDDEQPGTIEEEVESLGRCLSYSPDAPKALGIASKRTVHSSYKKGFSKKEHVNSSMGTHTNNTTSIAHLLVRYQAITELSSSSSSSS
eukprot:c18490_g2_i1 orf=3-455(-)